MELNEAEITKLKTLVTSWYEKPQRELEATFGEDGHVDASTFYAVINRLQLKGYTFVQEPDKLNILVPIIASSGKKGPQQTTNYRFTIQGAAAIKKYCNDNNIADSAFSVMCKIIFCY